MRAGEYHRLRTGKVGQLRVVVPVKQNIVRANVYLHDATRVYVPECLCSLTSLADHVSGYKQLLLLADV